MRRFVIVIVLFALTGQLAPATHSSTQAQQPAAEPQRMSVKGLEEHSHHQT